VNLRCFISQMEVMEEGLGSGEAYTGFLEASPVGILLLLIQCQQGRLCLMMDAGPYQGPGTTVHPGVAENQLCVPLQGLCLDPRLAGAQSGRGTLLSSLY
jgi:hypothetical protein